MVLRLLAVLRWLEDAVQRVQACTAAPCQAIQIVAREGLMEEDPSSSWLDCRLGGWLAQLAWARAPGCGNPRQWSWLRERDARSRPRIPVLLRRFKDEGSLAALSSDSQSAARGSRPSPLESNSDLARQLSLAAQPARAVGRPASGPPQPSPRPSAVRGRLSARASGRGPQVPS